MNAAQAVPVIAAISRIRYDPGPATGVRRIATAGRPSRVPVTRAKRPSAVSKDET